jgi:hypothetical protein
MPLQRRKKKKKAPPKKTSGMSQVQNVKVVVNAAGTAPRRRRRAPAKKKDAGFSFGGGGAGLAQVVSAPSVTQDVLQQSQELRQTLQQLQAGPLRNNAVLGEIGQIERPLLPDDQPVSRGQLKFVMGSVIEQQSLQNQAMTQGFEQYRALAGKQLEVLEQSVHSLSTTDRPPDPAMDRSESPVPLIPQPSPRGRSPTVREASMAAEPGTPPASPSPPPTTEKKSRTTYPQSVRDRVFTAWSENRQLPKGKQLSLEELAREQGLTLNKFNNIRQAESRKRS